MATKLKLIGLCAALGLALALVAGPTPHVAAAPLSLAVDVGQEQKPISPHIYGLNFARESFAAEIALPLRRWGGNTLSRYNWRNGKANLASDWYFENATTTNAYDWNVAEDHSGWIAQNRRTGTESLLTVPMLGYVAKNGVSCGFSVGTYGDQQDADPFQSDCGNGIQLDGTPVTGNNPLDTSVVAGSLDTQAWVLALVGTYGSAASGGVRLYGLDNEPDLWHETHRDVHPSPQTYDELLARTLDHAAAIKAADPGAKLLGYGSFGWTGYWYSAHDAVTAEQNGYTYFPDRATHGGMYQVEWYLDQLRRYEQQPGGIRLLDYLDLHFYPQNGVALATAGSSSRQALRLRSTRALWDPTYRDESWIGGDDQDPDQRYVRLIPRMRDWVAAHYPGTGLAVTEYNFGGLEHINGALAQADVLGIFGREGLAVAALWNYPSPGDPLGYDRFETLPGANAFRIYRNYDGLGGRFGDVSVRASSANQAQLAIYAAQRTGDSALTVVVINKTGGGLSGNVALAGFTPGATAQVYRYSAANLAAIVRQADQAVGPTGFVATFPANSISLVVIPAGTGGGGWQLLSPADGAVLQSLRPALDWQDYPGALGYNIQVSRYSNFSSVLTSATVNTPTSAYTLTTDLPARTVLYWRVRPKVGSTTFGNWSAVWSFTTGNPPSIPVLVSPGNGALVAGPSPLFDWKDSSVPAGAAFGHYQIQIARDTAFAIIVHDATRTGVTNSRDTTAVLAPATTYYWRVRSFALNGDHSAWSAVRNVRLQFAPPTLLQPAHQSTVGSLRPLFTWAAMTGVTGYTIQISTSSTFGTVAVSASVGVAQFRPSGNLAAHTTYHWRVRANGTYGPGAWSTVFRFTTP
jgi:hypothetical protein